MKSLSVLGALFSLLAVSCTTLQLPPVREDPDVIALRDDDHAPMPFAVAVAPFEADLEGVLPPDLGAYAISEDMAAILEVGGIFGAVRAVPFLEDGRVAVPPDADFLLKLRAHKLEVKYEGRNRWFLPNLLLWGAFVFPSWWVPDETFSARVDLEAVLVSQRSGMLVGSHTASVFLKRDLDDFQRGWFPLGILLSPAVFSRGNWRCVAREVLWPALRKAEVDLAKWMNGAFRDRVEAGEMQTLTSTTFALTVGISKYASLKIHNLREPRREAAVLTQFLTDPQLGGVPADQVLTLTDDKATRSAVLEGLEAVLVKAPRAPDMALIYISGYGAVLKTPQGPTHVLMTYESDPEKPAGPFLSLKALQDILSRSNAGRIIVVIDAGFAGSHYDRAATPPPLHGKKLYGLCSEMVVPGRGFVVLVEREASTGEGAFLPDFTAALAGKGDLNQDGIITGAEIKTYFGKVHPASGYSVRIFGEELDKMHIPFGKGRVKR
ncbi:MAG: caspase family protein [Planctomycetota bacterium]|jgi:hypothetical protein